MPKTVRRSHASVLFMLLAATLVPGAWAQTTTFTPGNLVVSVEGCGVNNGTCTSVPNGTGNGTGNSSTGGYGDNQAGPFTLFQYAPNGVSSATFVNSLVFPQLASGANLPVSGEYGSSSEASIQLDGTGRYLTVMEYGVNANVYNASPNSFSAAPNAALAQSNSLTGQSYTPIPRVITTIDAYGNVNSSTANYNLFNGNNPRSTYSVDGYKFYMSGQGTSGDLTGGVFLTTLGTNNLAPTSITGADGGTNQSQDTRFVQVYNNTLYISMDSKTGSYNRSYVGTLGTPPATSVFTCTGNGAGCPTGDGTIGPALLAGLGNTGGTGRVQLTAAQTNGINATGKYINISPENYFFASPTVLYIADSGSPKNTSATNEPAGSFSLCGAGGLQKWVNVSGTWTWEYTLYQGLNLVKNANTSGSTTCSTNTSGTTGLLGLTGTVSNGTVYLYATSFSIGDLDPSYLYGITDPLSATTNPGTTFTKLATAPADSNFKGVSLAPSLPAGSATITSVPSGLAFSTSGTGCVPGSYTTPVTLIWTPGSVCTLSTTSTQTGTGSTYTFSKWQDGTTATSDAVTAPTTSAVYTATFTTSNQPLGNLESAYDSTSGASSVVQTDSVYISGWAADAGDGAPLGNVKIAVDGIVVGSATTGVSRPDVAVYFDNPNYTNSGYSLIYPAATLTPGTHKITAIATNSAGQSSTFGPVSVTVTGAAPIGNLESAVDNFGGTSTVSQYDSVNVSGWVADYTDGSPLGNVKIYVDGTILEGSATTGISRPDVASYFNNSSFGKAGFTGSFSASSLSLGTHAITVVAVDSGGRSTTLGPITITVTAAAAAAPPFGNLETAIDYNTDSTPVLQSDSVLISGWAADTTDGAPVGGGVNVYIDGSLAGAATTGIARQDVATYFNNQAYLNSGYQLIYPASSLSTGSHNATVIATDSQGTSTTFGPISFTVQSSSANASKTGKTGKTNKK